MTAPMIVDVEGYEGPLDLLLTLARTQKVDLLQISVSALAEQYLAFVEEARELRIELAADYLVTAAWLAFLKSRLLLPPDPSDEGPSAQQMAADLAFRLERLEAMRRASARLMGRDRLGLQRFARGAPEAVRRARHTEWNANLLDLMQAYARVRTRDDFRPFAFDRRNVWSLDEALARMRPLLGDAVDWAELRAFLPEGWTTPERARAATATTFAASLELAKQGRIAIEQAEAFGPLKIKTLTL